MSIQVGDIIDLGAHRLLCGDATNPDHVAALMAGEKAEMLFTDPPYGVDYRGGHFHSGDIHIKREREALAGDQDSSVYAAFLPVVLPYIDGPCYTWCAGTRAHHLLNAVEANRCSVHALIIWHKINATYAAMGAQYKERKECCLYFKPKRSTLRWCGPTNERTIWEIKRDASNRYHPTQKPVALALRALGNHTATTVADFFAGSGSTILAAEQLGRRCLAMEIDPAYCQVIVDRYEAAQRQPELLSQRAS